MRHMLSEVKKFFKRKLAAIRSTRTYLDYFEVANWRKACAGLEAYQANAVPRRLLIMPSDPWTLQGAKGDEAMMTATIDRVRRLSPDVEIGIVIATQAAADLATAKGFQPISAWKRPFSYAEAVATITAFRPDITVVLGADVLDGYYSVINSIRMLLIADLSARLGAQVVILGFSFNASPAPALAPIFRHLHERVHVNLRDQVSFDRFVAFAGFEPHFVADVAFLLLPNESTPAVSEITAWIDSRRRAGRQVIGFNIHHMLFRHATSAQDAAIDATAAATLARVHAHRPVAFLLISHDSRKDHGDDNSLMPVRERLQGDLGDDIRYSPATLSAAEIKAIVSHLDGVVTARMHLAIAALGSGIPVAAVTYQDKFQGLLQHFAIDPAFALAPAEYLNDGRLEAMILRFIDELGPLGELVRSRLPDVLAKAEGNFDGVL